MKELLPKGKMCFLFYHDSSSCAAISPVLLREFI